MQLKRRVKVHSFGRENTERERKGPETPEGKHEFSVARGKRRRRSRSTESRCKRVLVQERVRASLDKVHPIEGTLSNNGRASNRDRFVSVSRLVNRELSQ